MFFCKLSMLLELLINGAGFYAKFCRNCFRYIACEDSLSDGQCSSQIGGTANIYSICHSTRKVAIVREFGVYGTIQAAAHLLGRRYVNYIISMMSVCSSSTIIAMEKHHLRTGVTNSSAWYFRLFRKGIPLVNNTQLSCNL